MNEPKPEPKLKPEPDPNIRSYVNPEPTDTIVFAHIYDGYVKTKDELKTLIKDEEIIGTISEAQRNKIYNRYLPLILDYDNFKVLSGPDKEKVWQELLLRELPDEPDEPEQTMGGRGRRRTRGMSRGRTRGMSRRRTRGKTRGMSRGRTRGMSRGRRRSRK